MKVKNHPLLSSPLKDPESWQPVLYPRESSLGKFSLGNMTSAVKKDLKISEVLQLKSPPRSLECTVNKCHSHTQNF